MAKKSEEKTRVALLEEEKRLRKEMLDIRFQHAVGRLTNTASIQKNRRDLARVLTQLSSLKK